MFALFVPDVVDRETTIWLDLSKQVTARILILVRKGLGIPRLTKGGASLPRREATVEATVVVMKQGSDDLVKVRFQVHKATSAKTDV